MSCDCAIQWPAAKSHNEWGKKVHYIYTYGAGVVHIGHNFVYRNGRRRLNNFTIVGPPQHGNKKKTFVRPTRRRRRLLKSVAMMIYIIFVSELLIFPRIQKRRGTTTTTICREKSGNTHIK